MSWSGRVGRTATASHLSRAPAGTALCRPRQRLRQPHRRQPTPNAASSRCCSVIWWTPPASPVSSIQKTGARWCARYQQTCAEVIQRFEGHVAQYLGDGLLVYFGYPQAHEDDAQRAVRTGLGMVQAMATLNHRLAQEQGVRLAMRVGIHTGLVVVGEVGGGSRQEQLAMGETPNLAARLQELAAPDTVVVSAATFRLVRGYFTAQELGAHSLKGVTAPVQVYRMLRKVRPRAAWTSPARAA